MKLLQYIQSLNGFLPPTVIFALLWAIGIYMLIVWAGGYLSKEIKDNTTLWLLGEYEGTWARQFCLLMDKIFGENHLSWKCFFRSSIASILFVLLLYFTFYFAGFLESKARTGNNISLLSALSLGIILNVIPDYLSLLETRWLLRWFQKVSSFWMQIFVLFLDLIFSGVIIWLAITLYVLASQGKMVTPAEMIGIFSIYSVFFYSTFFTSLLAWIYSGSALIMRISSKTFLKDLLDTEEKPFKSIALIASILAFLGVFFLSFALNNKDINELWCSTFPSTCPGVYRLTEDEQKAFKYLSRICEGVDEDFCMREANKYYFGDKSKTHILWNKACENGAGIGCLNLGWMYLIGREVEKNDKRAAEFFKKSCNSDDIRGCNRLGEMYLEGLGVEQDDKKAADLFRQACSQGKVGACSNLGWMYYEGRGVERDDKKVADLFRQACNQGKGDACTGLGLMYYQGRGVERDDKNAVDLFQQACGKGEVGACLALGGMYSDGRGVERDDKKAAGLYRHACDKGVGFACYNLGSMYQKGRGVERDDKKTVVLYRQACDKSLAEACNNLGWIYQEGRGIERDDKKAVDLYLQACDKGLAEACYNLGSMYQEGRGVERDDKKAVVLYRQACDKSLAKACYNLGWIYQEGRGVERNDKKAFDLFSQSCDKGVANACSSLGLMYYQGRGVERNDKKAFDLFSKACNQGVLTGCLGLNTMYYHGRVINRDNKNVFDLFK